MADSNFRGPVSNMGAMEDAPTNVQPLDGPSYSYQGIAIADLRAGAFQKDGIGAGRVPAFLQNPRIVVIDQSPSAASSTAFSAATAVVTATPMVLVNVAPGAATAGVPSAAVVPFVPFGATAVTTAIALDFGFTTGTTTSGSTTLPVPDSTLFTLNQWIVIGGVGNSAKTASLITQVQSIINSTSITINPAPSASLANAPIGGANLFNQFTPPATQFGPSAVAPTSVSPTLVAGLVRVINPLETLARNIAIQGTATASIGGVFIVNGFDVHKQAMSESITVSAGSVAAYGKKAFKYISSVIPQFTDTGTYSVGFGDTFGFLLRQDRWEQAEVMFNGARMVTNVGFTSAVVSVANATTGDVRGTIQLSALGNATAVAAPVAGTSNGVRRLTVIQTLPVWNNITGTPLNTAPVFGVTQS